MQRQAKKVSPVVGLGDGSGQPGGHGRGSRIVCPNAGP